MAIVGRAEVVVRALVDRFKQDLRGAFNDAEKDADTSGSKTGKNYGEKFSDAVNPHLENIDFSSAVDNASSKGDESGKKFGDSFDDAVSPHIEGIDFNAPTSSAGSGGSEAGNAFGGNFGDAVEPVLDDIDFSPISQNAESSGDDAGSGMSQAFRRHLDGIEADAGNSGNRSGNDFGGRFQNAIDRINPQFPDFGSRLALKFLAIIPLVGILGGGLSALVGGVGALAGALAGAAPAAGVLGAGIVGLIGTVAAGTIAFGGISNAVKFLGKSQTAGASSAATSAKSQAASAQAIQAAQDRVADAQARVVESNKALVESRQAVGEAQQQAAEDNAQAARDVEDAERAYTQAIQDETDAQNDLAAARYAASEAIQDAGFSVRDAMLDVTGAEMHLEDAREKLSTTMQDKTSTDRERQAAQLEYDRAQLSYDTAIDRRDDATKANNEAITAGIDGSSQVVAVNERIQSSHEKVAEAARHLDDERRAQAKTAKDGSDRIAKAQDGVRQAQDNLAKSMREVTRAQQALTQAQQKSNDAVAGGSDALAAQRAEFNSLSPAAREFAKLIVAMKPQFQGLRNAVAQPLFSALIPIMGQLSRDLFPTLKTVLAGTGEALGKVAQSLANTFTNTTFLKNFSGVMKQNESTIVHLANAAGSLARGFMAIFNAAGPLVEEFATYIEKVTKAWSATQEADQASGALSKKMDKAATVVKQLGRILKDLWDSLKAVTGAGSEMGQRLLDSLEKMTNRWQKWTKSTEGQNRLKEYFDNIEPVIRSIGGFVGELTKQFLLLGEDKTAEGTVGGIASTFRELTPLIKPLREAIENFTATVGPTLAPLLKSIIEVFKTISESKAFEWAIQIFTATFEALNFLLNIPGVGKFVLLLLSLAAGYKALAAVGKFTGLSYLKDTLLKGLFGSGDAAAKGPAAFIQGLRGVESQSGTLANKLGNVLHPAIDGVGNALLDFSRIGLGKINLGDFSGADRALRQTNDQIGELEKAIGKIDPKELDELEKRHPEAFGKVKDAINGVQKTVDGIKFNNLDALENFDASAFNRGKTALDALNQALGSTPGDPFKDVRDSVDKVVQNLDNVPAGAKAYGDKIGGDIAKGIHDQVSAVEKASKDLADGVADNLEQHSPAKSGPLSRNGGTRGWGADAGKLFADGLESARGEVSAASDKIGNAASSSLSKVGTEKYGEKMGTDTVSGLKRGTAGVKDLGKSVGSDFVSDLTSGNITSIQGAAASLGSSLRSELEDKASDAVMGAGSKVGGLFGKAVGDEGEKSVGSAGGKVAKGFSKVSGSFSTAARAIGTAMSFALGPVGLIIIVIAALVAGLIYAYKHSETFRNIVDGAMRAVADGAQWLWDKVQDVFGWLKDNWPLLLGIFLGPFGLALGLIIKFWDDIKAAATGVWDHIKTGFDDLIGFFTGLPARIAIIATTLWVSIHDKAIAIKDAVVLRFNELITFVTGLPARVATIALNLWNSIDQKADLIRSWVVGRFNALITFVTGLPGRVATVAKGLWNSVSDAAGNVKTWVENKFNSMITFFTGMPGRISTSLRNMFGGLKDGVRDAINYVIGKWNGLSLTLGGQRVDLPFGQGFNIPSITLNTPDIPYLAEGATINPRRGGTLAVLAEAGRAESVVDTGKLNRLISLVTAQVQNVSKLIDPTRMNALLHDSHQGSIASNNRTVILSPGAVVMEVNNPVEQTTEQTLNSRMRSLADLGVLERLVGATG